MKLIRPEPITPATLSYTNIAATTDPEWSRTETYAAGAVVKVSYRDVESPGNDDKIAPVNRYKCVTAPDPGTYPPDDDGTFWQDLGAENRWRWADQFIGTRTEALGTEASYPGELHLTVTADKCTAIGLFGVVGKNYRCIRYNSVGGVVSDTGVISLPNAAVVGDAWSYFFEDFVYTHDVIVEFGALHKQTVKIIITHSPSTGYYPSLGYGLVGRAVDIGQTIYPASTGITSFARKVVDENFGLTYLKPGNTSKWMDIEVRFPSAHHDRIQKTLASVDAIPTIYWGNNDGVALQSLNVLGWYHDFTITIRGPRYSIAKLEVKGLV